MALTMRQVVDLSRPPAAPPRVPALKMIVNDKSAFNNVHESRSARWSVNANVPDGTRH